MPGTALWAADEVGHEPARPRLLLPAQSSHPVLRTLLSPLLLLPSFLGRISPFWPENSGVF